MCPFVPLLMPILTRSHLTFFINVPVRHIKVNEKQFVQFCPKSDHMIFGHIFYIYSHS